MLQQRPAYFATPEGAREVDIALAIRAFRCDREEPSREKPSWLNDAVQQARSEFVRAVDRLQAAPAVTRPGAQKWVLKQLTGLARATDDQPERQRLSSLHRAFSKPLSQTVIHMLRRLQRQDINGPDFLNELDDIGSAYGLYGKQEDLAPRRSVTLADIRVVCSQAHVAGSPRIDPRSGRGCL